MKLYNLGLVVIAVASLIYIGFLAWVMKDRINCPDNHVPKYYQSGPVKAECIKI